MHIKITIGPFYWEFTCGLLPGFQLRQETEEDVDPDDTQGDAQDDTQDDTQDPQDDPAEPGYRIWGPTTNAHISSFPWVAPTAEE